MRKKFVHSLSRYANTWSELPIMFTSGRVDHGKLSNKYSFQEKQQKWSEKLGFSLVVLELSCPGRLDVHFLLESQFNPIEFLISLQE